MSVKISYDDRWVNSKAKDMLKFSDIQNSSFKFSKLDHRRQLQSEIDQVKVDCFWDKINSFWRTFFRNHSVKPGSFHRPSVFTRIRHFSNRPHNDAQKGFVRRKEVVRLTCCEAWGWWRLGCLLLLIGFFALPFSLYAANDTASANIPVISVNIGQPGDSPQQISTAVKILFVLTVLSIAPGLMVTLTSFTRTVIVLSFLRQALGIQQIPPNQVLIGLSLFITFFVMGPVMDEIYTEAYQPFMDQQISAEAALQRASEPIKEFMLKFTREKDLALFLSIANQPRPSSVSELPIRILIPAFIISELRTAFQIGFMIYLPFLVIDIIVSSILLSMGMMVLPPMLISLPLKLMLFVLIDGWNLLVESLVRSFQ